ncbi:DUF6515 family protein [Gilvibacter sp.]|uniref:DUF6515 family protein n=1 Tax=Gilvibacter sp. TaxID=2729997 RepID=UPI003B525385
MRPFLLAIIALLMFTISCARPVVVNAKPQVTVVKTAPKNHRIVVVRGQRYYTWNGKHYKKTRQGYVLVRI